jgi:ABC-2 type transport system permease protein
MELRLLRFWRYRYLLQQLVLRDIKVKYKRSLLGIFWSVLNPLLSMMVLSVVFAEFFRFQIKNFIVYFLSGTILFSFMSEATGTSLFSIFSQGPLLMKVALPKYIFPLAKSVSAFINMLFALLALGIMIPLTGVSLSPTMLLTPVLLIYLFLFVTGLSLIWGIYAVFFRDLVHLHTIFTMLWMYMTPLFYPQEIMPERYRWLLDINPIFYYIRYFRQIILDHTWPSLSLNLFCLGIGLISLWLGSLVFRRNDNQLILYI